MDSNEKIYELHNKILHSEIGSINYLWYEDLKSYLITIKEWALKNASLLKKEYKYDIEDIYKQLDNFEYVINHIDTITNTREEAVLLSLLSYALNNKPLIISSYNEYAAHHDSEEQKFKSALSNKVAILSNLISFYFRNHKNVECFNALKKLFLFYINEEIKLNYYADYGIYESEKLLTNKVRYENEYVIHYLKILIYYKDFVTANEIFDAYPVKPYNKKQTADYDRIKLKLGK